MSNKRLLERDVSKSGYSEPDVSRMVTQKVKRPASGKKLPSKEPRPGPFLMYDGSGFPVFTRPGSTVTFPGFSAFTFDELEEIRKREREINRRLSTYNEKAGTSVSLPPPPLQGSPGTEGNVPSGETSAGATDLAQVPVQGTPGVPAADAMPAAGDMDPTRRNAGRVVRATPVGIADRDLRSKNWTDRQRSEAFARRRAASGLADILQPRSALDEMNPIARVGYILGRAAGGDPQGEVLARHQRVLEERKTSDLVDYLLSHGDEMGMDIAIKMTPDGKLQLDLAPGPEMTVPETAELFRSIKDVLPETYTGQFDIGPGGFSARIIKDREDPETLRKLSEAQAFGQRRGAARAERTLPPNFDDLFRQSQAQAFGQRYGTNLADQIIPPTNPYGSPEMERTFTVGKQPPTHIRYVLLGGGRISEQLIAERNGVFVAVGDPKIIEFDPFSIGEDQHQRLMAMFRQQGLTQPGESIMIQAPFAESETPSPAGVRLPSTGNPYAGP